MKGRLGMLGIMAGMMAITGGMPVLKEPKNYNDLFAEYDLIQQKKSKLTRRYRDAIVAKVERIKKARQLP